MDAIAAVGFGWVIIQAIKAKGVVSQKGIASVSFKVAMISFCINGKLLYCDGVCWRDFNLNCYHGMNGAV